MAVNKILKELKSEETRISTLIIKLTKELEAAKKDLETIKNMLAASNDSVSPSEIPEDPNGKMILALNYINKRGTREEIRNSLIDNLKLPKSVAENLVKNQLPTMKDLGLVSYSKVKGFKAVYILKKNV